MRMTHVLFLGLFVSATAQAAPICHVKGNGGHVQIDVNANSLAAHYARGDWDTVTLYVDADGEGLGDPNPATSIQSCSASIVG